MNTETLGVFARCRSLALAAMIEAGGKPCSVAAGDCSTREAAGVRPAGSPSGTHSDAPETPPPSAMAGPCLTPTERERLACFTPAALAAIESALRRLGPDPVPHGDRRLAAAGPLPGRRGLGVGNSCKSRSWSRF
jgi:hypothetical protein